MDLCAHSVSVCVGGPARCACQQLPSYRAPDEVIRTDTGVARLALPISGWRFCGGLSDRYCSCGVLLSVSLPGPEAALAWSLFSIPEGDWI